MGKAEQHRHESPEKDLSEGPSRRQVADAINASEQPFDSVLTFFNTAIGNVAWKNWNKYEKPFISFIGLEDDLLGLPRIQNKWINSVPGAKGQDHEQFENANHFIQEDIGEIMADRTHKFIQKNPI